LAHPTAIAAVIALIIKKYLYDIPVVWCFLQLHLLIDICLIRCIFTVYRLTRIKIEDSALVKNMLSFQNQESQPVDLAEFANNLNVTAEDGSLISLFKMHLEVMSVTIYNRRDKLIFTVPFSRQIEWFLQFWDD